MIDYKHFQPESLDSLLNECPEGHDEGVNSLRREKRLMAEYLSHQAYFASLELRLRQTITNTTTTTTY